MSLMRVIVNPVAGAGKTAKLWPQIASFLDSLDICCDPVLTEYPGHAVSLAEEAIREGYKTLVSVGGDGTLNELVNGIYHCGLPADVCLGVICTGTGSDYIRTLRLPLDYHAAGRLLLSDKRQKVDLGTVRCKCEGKVVKRAFINFAGVGFDAEIVRATTVKYKALGKVTAYLLALFSVLSTYRPRDVTITIDNEIKRKRVYTVMMSHGKYGGGGMYVNPGADPSDGLFDVLTVGALSKPDLLWSLPRLYKGTHSTHPKVSVVKASKVGIDSDTEIAVQVDGDLAGYTPAEFSVLPGAVSFIV